MKKIVSLGYAYANRQTYLMVTAEVRLPVVV